MHTVSYSKCIEGQAMLNGEMSVVCAHVASMFSVIRNKFYLVYLWVLHTHSHWWWLADSARRGRPIVSRADERGWCPVFIQPGTSWA